MVGEITGILRKERPRAEPELLKAASVSVEAGIDGDFRGRTDERNVTVLAEEDWAAACADLGQDLPWTTRRANILTRGVALPQSIGARLKIGALELEVTEENEPCSVMEAQAVGLKAALKPDWRGGIACRVVTPGEIALGDAVEVLGN
jgi:MOSC domain-containing protein YiiM